MTIPADIRFEELDIDKIADWTGEVAVFVGTDGTLDKAGRRVNRLMRGALARMASDEAWADKKPASVVSIPFPSGMQASQLHVVCLGRRAQSDGARKAGGAIAAARKSGDLLVLAGSLVRVADLSLGMALRGYDFTDHKTTGDKTAPGTITVACTKPEEAAAAAAPMAAVAEGVFFTRDLVNEPANVLTTDDFAARLAAMQELGLNVEILEESDMTKLGMGALLGVGQGSRSPSKLVVMEWNGGGDEAPFALVGKGVVFDTGGISLKPAAGMEDMTMDMGGAGVVAGVMRTLALRKARANVVGVVGLVENMPDGNAQRPGDIVTSMKGDTIEVINTDAEGRLVLADALWYTQDRFNPSGVINLATLTGAIIIGLGHENAGVFSNDDALCNDFLKAAAAEGEGAWRMPMGAGYDQMIKSQKADIKNVGGRPAGSITAAQFLARFVRDGMPWIHLDIAGVAQLTKATPLAPKGATGWGVMALDRLIANKFET